MDIIINVLASVIGILTSGFIVVVNLLDWAKDRHLNTCDLILLAMGLSDASYQFILISQTYISKVWKEFYGLHFIESFLHQLQVWTGSSCLWLTSCLCVFFCVKIVDFNHPFFIWLKLRISKVVAWLLLGSVVGSLVLSFPVYWSTFRDVPSNSSTNFTIFSTVPDVEWKRRPLYNIVSVLLGCTLPLLLAIVSITLILTSLYRHTRRIKVNAAELCQPRLDAHFGAVKVVGSLLLLQILLFLVGHIGLFLTSEIFHKVYSFIDASTNAVQSFILILGNTKLKQALLKVFSPCKK